MKKITVLVIIAHAFAAFGCLANNNKPKQETNEWVLCSEKRPEMCAMQFDPVCAVKIDGSLKTYSNGCVACSDKQVKKYRKGSCNKLNK